MEEGTGLVRVILWRKEKECMAQLQMIRESNSNCYICVIEEVEDYYGVHEVIAFDVQPVSSGNEVKSSHSTDENNEYATSKK